MGKAKCNSTMTASFSAVPPTVPGGGGQRIRAAGRVVAPLRFFRGDESLA
jgi:hypothetical protein